MRRNTMSACLDFMQRLFVSPRRGTHRRQLVSVSFCLIAAGLVPACESTKKQETETSAAFRAEAEEENSPLFSSDEGIRLIRSTERNVKHFLELRIQGETQQMLAVRRAISRSVDDNFDTFRDTALKSEFIVHRNMAVKCLGFSTDNREKARVALIELTEGADLTLVKNAALGLGLLRQKNTDVTVLVKLLAHGDVEVRTNAATALKDIWIIKETPRELTPQYWTAIDRLISLLHQKQSIRGRRAAVWALANLRHPDVLEHLVSGLKDQDEYVQIGGLYGIRVLGDQRAIEPLLEFLENGPTTATESYAKNALVAIAVQSGFAKTPSECDDLAANPKAWRQWLIAKRMG